MAIEDFDKYLGNLKTYLPDVEDASFSWADVIGLLVIKLRNTDSLNKARTASHATQIQLTSESGASEGKRKTEDFFPTLTLNSSFKSWRIAIPTRIHRDNILQLDSNDKGITEKWIDDSIQIRRRILNEDEQGNGNPALQICYGNDLMPLRELLNVDDYIVVVKRKNSQVYEAFGVRSDVDLGSGKQLYVSTKASNDSTAFSLGDLTDNQEGWMRLEQKRISTGQNVLLYGVPGSGKSWTIEHEYCKPGTKVERLVFHPDYTYSDFIGQILPAVDEGGQVSYRFTPGPFTNILRDAYNHPTEEYILIIEEINRGNAPAIFGEVFQLLDRKVEIRDTGDDGFPIGTSEYGITNMNIAREMYGDDRKTTKVRIPSNFSIIGTMNTSDQNVFTLDTAFQRRWDMRLIENNFDNVDPNLADAVILDTTITWRNFCTEINRIVVGNGARMSSAEDKRLGAYFVHLKDLQFNDGMGDLSNGEYDTLRKKEIAGTITADEKVRLAQIRDAMKQNRRFPEKVIKYLWDDAFKFNREIVFETTDYQSLEQVIRAFMYASKLDRFKMFKENVRSAFVDSEQ